MSSKNITVYLNEKCPQGCFIRIVSKFFKEAPSFEFINTFSEEVKAKLLSYSPTKTIPLLKDGDLFVSGAIPVVKYLLALNPETKKLLVGGCPKGEAVCDMWLNFFINSISPIVYEINQQLNGKKKFNKDIFDMAINDLVEQLEVVNKNLTFKTFLLGNSISLPDLLLTSFVFQMFSKVLIDNLKSKIPHVIRHFLFVSSLVEVKDIYGVPTPIKEMVKPLPYVEPVEEKKEDKKEKKEKGDKKEKKEKGDKKEKKEQKKGEKPAENAKPSEKK